MCLVRFAPLPPTHVTCLVVQCTQIYFSTLKLFKLKHKSSCFSVPKWRALQQHKNRRQVQKKCNRKYGRWERQEAKRSYRSSKFSLIYARAESLT